MQTLQAEIHPKSSRNQTEIQPKSNRNPIKILDNESQKPESSRSQAKAKLESRNPTEILEASPPAASQSRQARASRSQPYTAHGSSIQPHPTGPYEGALVGGPPRGKRCHKTMTSLKNLDFLGRKFTRHQRRIQAAGHRASASG